MAVAEAFERLEDGVGFWLFGTGGGVSSSLSMDICGASISTSWVVVVIGSEKDKVDCWNCKGCGGVDVIDFAKGTEVEEEEEEVGEEEVTATAAAGW